MDASDKCTLNVSPDTEQYETAAIMRGVVVTACHLGRRCGKLNSVANGKHRRLANECSEITTVLFDD